MLAMAEQRDKKLKSVLDHLPPGFYADSRWLTACGVRRSSIADYAKGGWLRHVAHGLYQRPGMASGNAPHDWRVLVLSMQMLMGYPVHVGGMTALQLLGHRHYLSLGSKDTIFLYAPRFPAWLSKPLVDAPLNLRKTSLFGGLDIGLDAAPAATAGAGSREWWDWSLRLSSPERAILEALDELPGEESFHAIDVVFQSLVSLRPRRQTALLAACRSVKVKRLFLVFADRHRHSWFKHLDLNAIDLGKGDRSLVKGGKLHPAYRITVPADLLSESTDEAHGG